MLTATELGSTCCLRLIVLGLVMSVRGELPHHALPPVTAVLLPGLTLQQRATGEHWAKPASPALPRLHDGSAAANSLFHSCRRRCARGSEGEEEEAGLCVHARAKHWQSVDSTRVCVFIRRI